MKVILMLEDGKSFSGESWGGSGESIGKVILNTAVVGYQESLTDPANAGRIIVFTYPLIGNYGVAPKFNESKKVWARGAVIKENSRIFSNWQAKGSFNDFAKENNLPVISGVDTRSLAVYIRQKGEMAGIISSECFEAKELLAKINAERKNHASSLLPDISVSRKTMPSRENQKLKRIAVLDLGMTKSMLKQLRDAGFCVTLFPHDALSANILSSKPRGLIISGGPEDDPALENAARNIQGLVGKIPLLGISAGFHVIARACGAKIIKMKLGHHGVNYPVYNPFSHKSEITVQNHSSAVDTESFGRSKDFKITGYNLNDRTIEEVESKKLKIIGVQYEPVSPGFDEVNPVFGRFMKYCAKE
jgi:carbamoyl-phosphate synthase small subunit